MDPIHFLTTEDQFEIIMMIKVADEVMKLRVQRDEQLAVLIANAVWQAVK